jgi:hypothetical protein
MSMKRIIMSAIVAGALLAPAAAFAAESTGVIKSIDNAKREVTLDSGVAYRIPHNVDLSKFKMGQHVTIDYDVKNGVNEASSVQTDTGAAPSSNMPSGQPGQAPAQPPRY